MAAGTIIGPPLRDLTVADLERFLSAGDEEPITWEAKGTERPRPTSVRKHVSGFANRFGGLYMVGVSGSAKSGWNVDGVDFQDDEPGRWLSDVITALRPAPSFDVQVLEVGDNHVAIVEVEPAAVPPCMTPEGGIYERVAGKTIPVTEPLVLLDLAQRGARQRERARELALLQSSLILSAPIVGPRSLREQSELQTIFALVVAAAGVEDAVRARPFTRAFASWLGGRVKESLHVGMVSFGDPWMLVSQNAVSYVVNGIDQAWGITASRDGTVALTRRSSFSSGDPGGIFAVGDPPGTPTARAYDGDLTVAWRLAVEAILELGCRGPGHLVLRFDPDVGMFAGAPRAQDLLIERAIDNFAPPAPEEIAASRRELARACGYAELEPDA